jgi:hypothetical protein
MTVLEDLERAQPFYGPGPCPACHRWPGEQHSTSCRVSPSVRVAGAIEPRAGQIWAFDPPPRLDNFARWAQLAPRPWRMRLIGITSSGTYGRAILRMVDEDGADFPVPPGWVEARNLIAAKYGEPAVSASPIETRAPVLDLRAQRAGWRFLRDAP